MASSCLRKKVSLGIVICALVLWLFSVIASVVLNKAAVLDENRIWCDTRIPASVRNITEVFADFEISCLASVAYQQGSQAYTSEVAVDCSEGLEAARMTEHPAFCTKGGSTCLRKLFGQAKQGAFASKSTQQHDKNISELILDPFIATLTTAVIADIIGQTWSMHERLRDNIHMQQPLAISTCLLFWILCFVGFMPLVFMALDFWMARLGPYSHFLVKANVERVLPYYEDFRMLCSAQLSLPLDDGSLVYRDLKVDCRNGLRAAQETQTVTLSLSRPYQTSNLTLVRQPELEWTRFSHEMHDIPVSLHAKHQVFVVTLAALGLLILRVIAEVQAPQWLDGMCRWWAVHRTISPESAPLI